MGLEHKGLKEIIGYMLRHARGESGLTIREAGKILGIPWIRVSHIECGKGDLITVPEIEAYTKVLRIAKAEGHQDSES